MGWYQHNSGFSFYQKLPKVDLHRHLEGSLRLSTLEEIARKFGITLPLTPGLNSLVQMQQHEPLNFSVFLSKFQTLRLFYRSPDVIRRVVREAIADAAADQVRYLELHFTPVALSRAQGYPLGEVMDWVAETAQEASQQYHITTRLIASINRHESPDLAEQVALLSIDRIGKGIVGFGMAGNEAEFSALPFAPIFQAAKKSGLKITVHAGEWGKARNIVEAVESLGADRIGHGVRVLEDPEVTAFATERRLPFEVCLTSNHQSGVVSSMAAHPLIRMYVSGLNVSLHTDDPGIQQITLSDEYCQACETLGMPREALANRILAAVRASFLPAEEKQKLEQSLKDELESMIGMPVPVDNL